MTERDTLKASLTQSEAQRHNALGQLQQYRRLVEEAEAKMTKQPTLTATPVSHEFFADKIESKAVQWQTDSNESELEKLKALLVERDTELAELSRQRDEAFQLVLVCHCSSSLTAVLI